MQKTAAELTECVWCCGLCLLFSLSLVSAAILLISTGWNVRNCICQPKYLGAFSPSLDVVGPIREFLSCTKPPLSLCLRGIVWVAYLLLQTSTFHFIFVLSFQVCWQRKKPHSRKIFHICCSTGGRRVVVKCLSVHIQWPTTHCPAQLLHTGWSEALGQPL